MQHIPKWITLLIIGFMFIGVAATYTYQSYRYHDVSKLIKEAAQVALTESTDYSARSDAEVAGITESVFEQRFKDQFEELSDSFDVKNYSFNYKKDGDYYKAIHIKIIDDQDSPHEVTWVTDLSKNQ